MKRSKRLIWELTALFILLSVLVFKKGHLRSPIVKPVTPKISFEYQIEKTIGSVVHIANNSRGWQGSGVAIASDLILTARHVVEGGTEFTVTLNNGRSFKAHRAISSENHDLAFIKIDYKILKPAVLDKITECKLGRQVYVIGSPFGKINFNSVTLGIVSGINRNWDALSREGDLYGWSVAFTTDAAGHPGNSGCPVFTMDGKVRGILVGGFSPVLICVMPVDLIIKDVPTIQLMFDMGKYYKEEARDYNYGY